MSKHTTVDENKILVMTFLEECVNDDLDQIDEFVAQRFVGHNFPGIGEIHGCDEFRAFFETLRSAFDDFKAAVEDVIAEGDMVVVRATVTGTHTGSFLGVESTDEEITMFGIRIFRIEDCEIAEIWANLDIAHVLDQLNAMPESVSVWDAY